MKYRIALLQTDPQPGDIAGNVERALECLALVADGGADLAVLPEMWPRSYVDALDAETADWPALVERWREAVATAGIGCLGSVPVCGHDGTWRNRALLLGRDGSELAHYDKIHLFTYMNEQQRFSAGSTPVVADFEGLKLGLAICYDLRFPELYRALRAAGAEVLITIAQWPLSRIDHWDVLIRARAIENLCVSIGVNRCGSIATPTGEMRFGGHSAAIDPWGEPHWVAGERFAVGTVDVDTEAIAKRRAEFPVYADRRLGLDAPGPAT